MVPSVSKEYLLCNNNNRQKFTSNHFDILSTSNQPTHQNMHPAVCISNQDNEK